MGRDIRFELPIGADVGGPLPPLRVRATEGLEPATTTYWEAVNGGTLTISLSTASVSGAVLSGTLTKTFVNGLAVFDDLVVSRPYPKHTFSVAFNDAGAVAPGLRAHPGTVALWHFAEASGTTCADSVGSDHLTAGANSLVRTATTTGNGRSGTGSGPVAINGIFSDTLRDALLAGPLSITFALDNEIGVDLTLFEATCDAGVLFKVSITTANTARVEWLDAAGNPVVYTTTSTSGGGYRTLQVRRQRTLDGWYVQLFSYTTNFGSSHIAAPGATIWGGAVTGRNLKIFDTTSTITYIDEVRVSATPLTIQQMVFDHRDCGAY